MFLAEALSSQRCLSALLLARLQVEGVPLNVLDDVLLKDFSLEALERAFQALAFVHVNFSQRDSPRFLIRFDTQA